MITNSSQAAIKRDIVVPDDVQFRAMLPSDENFVYSSFVKSAFDKCILLDRFRLHLTAGRRVCEHILQHVMTKATCVILANTAYLNEIVGYVIFEREGRNTCIHYLYVKEGYRGMGYYKLLYAFATRGLHEDDTVHVSMLSPKARNIMDSKRIAYQWQPAMLFSKKTFQTIEDNQNENQKESQG